MKSDWTTQLSQNRTAGQQLPLQQLNATVNSGFHDVCYAVPMFIATVLTRANQRNLQCCRIYLLCSHGEECSLAGIPRCRNAEGLRAVVNSSVALECGIGAAPRPEEDDVDAALALGQTRP